MSALWNHAPKMWERLRAEKFPYPDPDREDMAGLFAFLYTARCDDEPGDERRGERLFTSKGCSRCHKIGGGVGPDLSMVAVKPDLQANN